MFLNDLPLDIICIVLSYVSLKERIHRARLVCNLWNTILPFDDLRQLDVSKLPFRREFGVPIGPSRHTKCCPLSPARQAQIRQAVLYLTPRIGRILRSLSLPTGCSFRVTDEFLNYLGISSPRLTHFCAPGCCVSLAKLLHPSTGLNDLQRLTFGDITDKLNACDGVTDGLQGGYGVKSLTDNESFDLNVELRQSDVFAARRQLDIALYTLHPARLPVLLHIVDVETRRNTVDICVKTLHFKSPKSPPASHDNSENRPHNNNSLRSPARSIHNADTQCLAERPHIAHHLKSLSVPHGAFDTVANICQMPSLEHMALQNCVNIQDFSFPEHGDDQQLGPTLTSLDLSGCSGIADFQFLTKLQELRHLNLSGTLFQYGFLLKQLLSLETVDLSYCRQLAHLDDDTFVRNSTALQGLNISGCTALTSWSFLSTLLNVTMLELREVTSIAEDNNFTHFPVSRSLTHLDLCDSPVNTSIVQLIIHRAYPLTYLNLGNSDTELISTHDLAALLETIKKTIERLFIACIQGYNPSEVLHNGILSCENMTELEVNASGLTKNGLVGFLNGRIELLNRRRKTHHENLLDGCTSEGNNRDKADEHKTWDDQNILMVRLVEHFGRSEFETGGASVVKLIPNDVKQKAHVLFR